MSKLNKTFCERKDSTFGMHFIGSDKQVSDLHYKDLYADALKMLAGFREKGIRNNEEIIIQICSDREFLTCFWACILGGIIAVPIPFCDKPGSVGMLFNVLKKLNKPHIYLEEKHKSEFNKAVNDFKNIDRECIFDRIIDVIPSEIVDETLIYSSKEEDIAMIQFSSGSTGLPKGVAITHGNLMSNCEDIFDALEVKHSDRLLTWLPYIHNFALIGGHVAPLIKNMEQYKMSTELFLLNSVEWLNYLSRYKITISISPNFGFMRCIESIKKELEYDWDFSNLRVIISGSEPINDNCCQMFIKALEKYGMEDTVVVPAYGMSETTLAISIGKGRKRYKKFLLHRDKLSVGDSIELGTKENTLYTPYVEVGECINRMHIRITNNTGDIVKSKVVGNIEVSGKSVMKGYYNDLENTSKAFTEDGWLQTGDIGVMIEKRLVILGRKKEIIFLNGKNYYPSDFEDLIYQKFQLLPETIAVSGFFDEKLQSEKVVLFMNNIYRKEELIKKIKKEIFKYLHVTVEDIVFVEAFPKTGSGKIQRFKLLEMLKQGDVTKIELSAHAEKKETLEAISPEQEWMLETLKHMLEDDNIEIDDDFMDLGLNSIKAGKFIALINEKYGLSLDINKAFEYPTVRKLSIFAASENAGASKLVKVVAKTSKFRASAQQQRMYALNKMDPGSINYNIFYGLKLDGELCVGRAETAFRRIIDRHEVLRTNFIMEDGITYQIIHDPIDFKINYVEHCDDVDGYIHKFIRPFNLEADQLIRVLVIKTSEQAHIMVVDVHHIVSDGSTMGYIINEFCKLYAGNELTEPQYQYKDYSNWQSEFIGNEKYLMEEKYWTEYLKGKLHSLELPLDYERQNAQSFEGSRMNILLGEELTQKLRDFSKEFNVTDYMVLMSAYSILLSKYTNQQEILVGSTILGRSLAEFMNVMGLFVNTVVFRNRPEASKTYGELLTEVKKDTLNAYANQDYQLDWLIKKLKVSKEKNRNPIFDVMFNMQNMELPEINVEGLKAVPYTIRDDSTRFELILIINELKNDIKFEFIYCNKLFKEETILQYKNRFIQLLKLVVENPQIRIGDIRLINEEEKYIAPELKDLDFSFAFN